MFHVIKLLMLEKRGEQGQGLTKRVFTDSGLQQ